MIGLAIFVTMMTAPDPPTLRVLTYNIHHGQGEDGVFDLERIARVIKSVKPDLVALQEVDKGTERSSGVDQATVLGELTGMHVVFGEAMPYEGGSYGEAVLSRWPIVSSQAHALPYQDDQEPRAALVVRVKPGGGLPELLFVGTHLCHQSDQTRLWQCGMLNTLFVNSTLPVVLAGDLNANPGSRPMRELLSSGWIDADAVEARPTSPSSSPRRRIDYVLYRSADPWKVVSVEVLDEPVASDHAPVFVVLAWKS